MTKSFMDEVQSFVAYVRVCNGDKKDLDYRMAEKLIAIDNVIKKMEDAGNWKLLIPIRKILQGESDAS